MVGMDEWAGAARKQAWKMRKPPNTECELCWWAEATLWQKLVRRIDESQGLSSYCRLISDSMYSIITGKPRKTWEERHKELWVTTGDLTELIRMERHIQK